MLNIDDAVSLWIAKHSFHSTISKQKHAELCQSLLLPTPTDADNDLPSKHSWMKCKEKAKIVHLSMHTQVPIS